MCFCGKSDIDALWKKLQDATCCNSLLKKHLTPVLFKQLKSKKTKFGGTLAHCIRSGYCFYLKNITLIIYLLHSRFVCSSKLFFDNLVI